LPLAQGLGLGRLQNAIFVHGFDRRWHERSFLDGDEQVTCSIAPGLSPTNSRGKAWIEKDNFQDGVATELVRAGIPQSHIVLAFCSPELRKHTDYAVA
jgi:hypothetical protein